MKITVLEPKEEHGSTYYRIRAPFDRLALYSGVSVIYVSPDQYHWLSHCDKEDILFCWTPQTAAQLKAIQGAKERGIKVWLDFDDNVFQVPIGNIIYNHYMSDETQGIFSRAFEAADLVTVPTDYLAHVIGRKHSGNIVVIPNAIDDNIFSIPDEPNAIAGEIKNILYRGGRTHLADFTPWVYSYDFLPALNRYSWTFLGLNPHTVGKNINIPYHWAPFVPFYNYYDFIIGNKPDAFFVTLQSDGLSAAKSNIAYLEAAVAGAYLVAQGETLPYRDCYYLKDFESEPWMWNCIKQDIETNYTLTVVNKKRMECIENLMRSPVVSSPST